MYLSTPLGVMVYWMYDPEAPTYLETYDQSGDVRESEVVGNYLYMVTKSSLDIADLADPSDPVLSGEVWIGATVDLTQLAIWDQYAYIQGDSSPVYACRIYPPDNPTLVCELCPQYFISIFGNDSELVAYNGYLYSMTEYTGIRIFDLY
jgi:hypothetical protein